MLKKISSRTKKIIYIISFSLLTLIFLLLVFLTIDGKKIREIKEFIHADTRVIYITEDENLDYPIKIMDKYSIDYMKINNNEFFEFA